MCFDDILRPNRKGEGVALIYRNNLKMSRCPSNQYVPSFECATWKVNNSDVRVGDDTGK